MRFHMSFLDEVQWGGPYLERLCRSIARPVVAMIDRP